MAPGSSVDAPDRQAAPTASGVTEPDDTEAERHAIRRRAMNLLARREHARAELVAKLVKRGHAADDVEVVVDELAGEGLQSDTRYAEAAVTGKAQRGIGPVRIAAELRSAGVEGTIIDTALRASGVDWCERAAAARRKRFGAGLPDAFPEKAKQMRFLQRRGFDGDQLAAVFDG